MSKNTDTPSGSKSNGPQEPSEALKQLRAEQAARWQQQQRSSRARNAAVHNSTSSVPHGHILGQPVPMDGTSDNPTTSEPLFTSNQPLTQPSRRVTRNIYASSPPPVSQPQPTGPTDDGNQELSDYELAIKLQEEEIRQIRQSQTNRPRPQVRRHNSNPLPPNQPQPSQSESDRTRQEQEDEALAYRLAIQERDSFRATPDSDNSDDDTAPQPRNLLIPDPFSLPQNTSLPSSLQGMLSLLHSSNGLPPLSHEPDLGLNSFFSFGNTMRPSLQNDSPTGPSFVFTGNSPFTQFLSPLQSMLGSSTNVDNLTYEQLLELSQQIGQARPKGATESQISVLPTFEYKEGSLGPEDPKNCSICLEDWKVGDSLMRLPCLHVFHDQCSQHWLKINRVCPVCKHPVTDSNFPPEGSSS